MKIKENQISHKEIIGELDGDDVEEMATKGGLWLAVAKKSGKILGVGSHRAISRHIAQKENPDLKINSLTKSESLPLEILEMNLPEFEQLMDRIRKLE